MQVGSSSQCRLGPNLALSLGDGSISTHNRDSAIPTQFKQTDEDPKAIATNIIVQGLGITGIEVIRAKHFGAKPELNRRGVIKAEFATKDQRDRICKVSKLLNDHPDFKHNYINKSRTPAEMVQRRNAQKFLSMIPGCEHMKVNWYGEVYEPSYRGTGRGRGLRGRGGGRGGYNNGTARGGLGTASTSNGAGRGGTGATFDGSVFSHPPPNIGNLSEFPNLSREDGASSDTGQ